MAFKGTTTRSAAAIAEEVEAVGGHINAYTAREQTAYYVKMLKEDTALGFDIIGDILTHSVFEPEELERERSVILQEIGQANDTPDDIIFDHFQTTAYPDQSLGTSRARVGGRDPQHAPDGADRLHDPQLHQQQRGGGGHRQAAARGNPGPGAEAFLRPAGQLPAAVRRRDLPGRGIPRGTRPGSGARGPGVPVGRLQRSRLLPTVLLSTLLGGGMSSRLFQEIREKRGLVYSIYSFAAPFNDGGLFGIYAGTGESEAAELMPVMLAELGKVQTQITEPELSRARAQLKASLLMSQESTGSRCEQLARQIQTFGRVIPTAEVLGKINAVTEADIRRAAARHFRARADAGDGRAVGAGADAGEYRGDAGGLTCLQAREAFVIG